MKHFSILVLSLLLGNMTLACKTAKVKYNLDPSLRSSDVRVTGATECRVSGDLVLIDFPNQSGCTGKIWDFQRKKCATHIPSVDCDSYTTVITKASALTSSTSVLDNAKTKAAKILACGERETSQYKDLSVQVVYPPDSKSQFTQAECETGRDFRIETICFRLCKTEACQTGIVTGKDADKLVFDCLAP